MTSHRMFSLVCLVVAACFASSVTAAGNKYPIILVHGFGGWSREEFGGNKYWGGFHGDWQEDLKKQGYDVRTAVVGPFSSNWDRACELYAYIKGGTVNYGANHAKAHGHNVTGRTFPGLFPEWGTVVNGELQKVHLIGHSMGGQTARMLAQLLEHGTKGAPTQEDPASHPLFEGGKSWVHSITTIATPNQGTLIGDGLNMLGDAVENFVGAIVGVIQVLGSKSTKFFDAKLDQWNLTPRGKDEDLKKYVTRVMKSAALHDAGKDLCLYSLSTVGAKEENQWVKTLPDIFYYSITNKDTFRLLKVELPRIQSMLLPLQPLATFLGSSYVTKKGFSKDWQQNDGAVNTPSMLSDGQSEVVEGVKESVAGRWHHVGLFSTLDHEAVVGIKLFVNAFDMYASQARVLYELPSTQAAGRNLRSGPVSHVHSEEAVRRLTESFETINRISFENDAAVACANPVNDEIKQLCDEHLRTL
ncbi:hypothetical protein Poli38472_008018 [Pythium oligandrum]|uniref:Lipase-like C-terminal domain-containing protein n=1 Tax=Pythium oligandrum TaxID=41045 RepID=A0A8K1CKN7_PYTOL|nr:hypothetical protein Poli38472_008018 [Pythium oligandrum]|eukprot:TMW65376.1 hypothetical protein Poli38472_008018 [Pythium oligandrum]